jgi:hypothetical protein
MTKAESEIREKLEREKDTMRRQELIKALWKITRQTQAADSVVRSGQGQSPLHESGTTRATPC